MKRVIFAFAIGLIASQGAAAQTLVQQTGLYRLAEIKALHYHCGQVAINTPAVMAMLKNHDLDGFNPSKNGPFKTILVRRYEEALNDLQGKLQDESCQQALSAYGRDGNVIKNILFRAGDQPQMSAMDFLVDGKDMAGQPVTVTGCTIIGAMQSIVMCNVRNGRNDIGNVILDGDTLERADLRRSLRQCADMRPRRECDAASVTGKVYVSRYGSAKLLNARITWKLP